MRALISLSSPPLPPPTSSRNPNSLIGRSFPVISTAETQVSDEPSAACAAVSIPPFRRRRLILLRHADSAVLSDRSLKDHDRPLSKAGRSDAALVAKELQQMGWIPELILSSDARRTKETLKIMQEHVKEFSEAEAYFMPSFYSVAAMDGQTADHLSKVICQYSRDEILTVMCMGHNKGWEEAATIFSGALVELKTCNAALLEGSGKSWTEAFVSAGIGGWKLHGIVKPNSVE